VCFGVLTIIRDSHKRVKKTRKKISKKQKIFLSRLFSSFSNISSLSSSALLFREEEEVKEEGEDEKNTEEPQRTTSSLLLEQPQNAHKRDKSDHAFKRRGVEEATKKLVI